MARTERTIDWNKQVEQALLIASLAHKGQVDKLGKAYILHPLAVASQLSEPKLKCIGLLHDVIEDCEASGQFLRDCGLEDEVVEVVEILTHGKDEDYFEYLARVKQNPDARMVKLADLAHNTSPERAEGLTAEMRKKYKKAKKMLEK